jgi:DHA2 family multidrug resistance protein
VRLFGGQIGVTVMTRFIAEREKLHSFLVGLHVQPGDWMTAQTVTHLTGGLVPNSSGVPAAAGRAVGITAGNVRVQAYALSFIDAFHFIAWTSFVVLILVATLRGFPQNYRDLRASSRP